MPVIPPKQLVPHAPVTRLTPYANTDKYSLYLGNCISVMTQLPKNSVDLLFADPPFNIGLTYDSYEDNKSDKDYLDWSRSWIQATKHVMKSTGSLFVAIGLRYQAELKKLLDEAGYTWRDTICWHYTFGSAQQKKFTPSWVAIHYYTVGKKWTWNADYVRIPSARQLIYDDKRANQKGKIPDNVWVLIPGNYPECFLPDQNIIMQSRVCGTFKERTDHPCQMPEPVLQRIIGVASNPHDLVLDPFVGSGTTGAVALQLERKFIGIDISEHYLRRIVLPRLDHFYEN